MNDPQNNCKSHLLVSVMKMERYVRSRHCIMLADMHLLDRENFVPGINPTVGNEEPASNVTVYPTIMLVDKDHSEVAAYEQMKLRIREARPENTQVDILSGAEKVIDNGNNGEYAWL